MNIKNQILELAECVQTELNSVYTSAGELPKDSPLQQSGLKDGLNIIQDYIFHGEQGLACEHLDYMVSECEGLISNKYVKSLSEIKNYFTNHD